MLNLKVGLILLGLLCNAFAFQFAPNAVRYSSQLMMAGGRSPEERQLSKRQMFLKVRDAFNEAAKAPGFFETGDRPVV